MKPRVYIETTIPSFYHEVRSRGDGKMKKDPVIEEIRAVRRKISRRFGHDSKALVAHYMELQAKYAGRLVAGPSAVHPTAVSK